ncbi:hypothetical protein SAMN00017405_1641 [Desulfonispora thiosulfatigenes DSM 11270]|uniref:Probable cell division protein WhiA n=1 Tax=Desulfonispora thiosulfatigenes DSM 11270 TaxID=656914 RepID=A0A1W1UXG8_DESTI|nr:DNA-binding protein WhiA [Desulfonispora thiosulfatigenes]SMB85451.1 hypothetical protein SAMN00017405_1641 [Desulfonispora thiosulfatigenes DSM 11270]
MSFSAKTKNELARIIDEDNCCNLAELAGLVRMIGTIIINKNNCVGLELTTESAAIARKILKLAKMIFTVETEVRVLRKNRLKKNNIYLVKIPPHHEVAKILDSLGVTKQGILVNPKVCGNITKNQCCQRSYLRGTFLGAGSVSSPENAYHLEIVCTDVIYANSLVELLAAFDLKAKISKRKKFNIVYLKESEQIVTFLNVVGAHVALLDFENIRIQKGLRNRVNRLVNCETANLNKTIDASMRQVENIEFIQRKIGLDKLPNPLRQVAELRMLQPDISLKELGELLEPPIGKSGINHRMRKLEEISEKLRNTY